MLTALDLFCGAGGVCLGLQSAGFAVVGVDRNPNCGKYYPGEFVLGDALRPPVDLDAFDFVWASPPCQRYSYATPTRCREDHPDLIPAVRELLQCHPYTAIENVPTAPIRPDLKLNGLMVGLPRIVRKRVFELSLELLFGLEQPPLPKARKEDWDSGYMAAITTSMSAASHYYARKKAGLRGRIPNEEAREIMGIPIEMPTTMVGESVPPAMARYVGEHAMERIRGHRHGGRHGGGHG